MSRRIISEEERLIREILNHETFDQEGCRLRNGIKSNFVPLGEIVDPNTVWYKFDDRGQLHTSTLKDL